MEVHVKRLVVCCDGTWNRPDQTKQGVAAPTNVAKISLALAEEDDAGNPQMLHYEAGVGMRRGERLVGGGFGIGLSRNVPDCYRFLVESYEPGDKLYCFGFSRGAYTARSTVGLVRNAGILRPEHRHRIKQAYALYRNPTRDSEPSGIASELFRRSYSHAEIYVDFVGVWDTVGALGIPIDGFRPPLLSRLWTFHDTTLSRYVLNAYHAMAIDERRKPFKPTLWVEKRNGAKQAPEAGKEQTIEQLWFAGVHSDVGGGYSASGLSDIALMWMVEKARGCGLVFESDQLAPAPDPDGSPHDSLSWFYRRLGPYDRRLTGASADEVVVNPWLAASAKTRYSDTPAYRPPGLGDWIDADGPVMAVPDGR